MAGSEVGTPGLRQNFGYINEEWDRRLTQISKRKSTLREMQSDATISASLKAIDALARSTDYQLDPADDAPPDVLALIDDCLNSMDGAWGDKLSEILSMIVYGFSLFEVVYVERSDGMIGWDKWAPRGQETIDRWEFDAEGRDWTGAVQVNPNTGKQYTLPRSALLHFVTVSRKQSPEGESLIRPAFDPWYFAKHIRRIEANGIERDYTGWPWLEISEETYADETLRGQWMDVIAGMRNGEESGIVTPASYDANGNKTFSFSVVTSAGTRNIDTDTVINRYQRDIMRNLLVDWLMLGDSGGGSFALGVSKAEVFASFVQSILDTVADTITEQAIKPLCVLNGIPEEYAPSFRFETLIKQDVPAIVEQMVKLIGAGVLDSGKAEVMTLGYELMGLPMPEGGFDDREPEPVATPDPIQNEQTADDAQDDVAVVEDEPDPKPKAFTEDVTDDLVSDAAALFKRIAGPSLGGLIDAELVA